MKTGFMKRLTSITIAAALVLSLSPTSALATDTVEEITVSEAADFPMELEEKEYKITLAADVTLPDDYASFSGVPKNGSLTFDLNGHTFSMVNGWFCNYGTLVITDSSADGTGVFNQSPIGKVCLLNSGNLTVEGGSFGTTPKSDEEWSEYYAIVNAYTVPNDTQLTISGGEFHGSICQFDSCITATNITGGTFHKAIDLTKGSLDIAGGTFHETISVPNGGLHISGGAFDQKLPNAWGRDFSITGGTFQYNPVLCYDNKPVNFMTHDLVLNADETFEVRTNSSGSASVGIPVITVDAEHESSTVTLNSETDDAVIYYSEELNGTYTQYAAPIMLTENTTLYTYAVKDNLYSGLAYQDISVGYLDPPTASPAGGTYTGSVQVTLTAEKGATILYSTDGKNPDFNGSTAMTTYTGPFTLTTSTTVHAVADKNGRFSDVMTAVYTITSNGGGGGSSGGSSSPSNADRNNNTTNNTGGANTTTVTDKATGTVTATTTAKDGTVTKVETTKDGAVSKVQADISANAAQTGKAIVLPAKVPVALRTSEAVVVDITIPKDVAYVKIAIPVEKATPGTVAVLVGVDGKEKVIRTSVVTSDGVVLKLDGSVMVKIVDNSKSFEDIPGTFWASDAVAFAASRELFHGTGATTFSPNAPMTREMLMTVLARLDGADAIPLSQGMAWAVERGISDGSNPTDSISREQLAVMLYRYAGSPAVSGSLDAFNDAGNVGDYAQAAMRWAVSSGIVSGMGGGVLDPQGEASRAQVATMLQHFITNLNR